MKNKKILSLFIICALVVTSGYFIKAQLTKTLTKKQKPIIILMETEMGNGVDFMMGTHEWHGKAPNDELLVKALDQNPETIGDY